MFRYSIMVRTTKKTTVTETPVVVETKIAKVKKTKAVDVAPPAPIIETASVIEDASTIDAVPPTDAENTETELANQSTEFLSKLQQMSSFISSLKTEFRVLEKKWTRELKAAHKLNAKRKRKSGTRAPSGFVKPTRISDELASFLGKDKGTEMARTAVTREINTYIRSNKLQDPANGRKINPDAKLTTLLKLKKSDELTYFNLQRYMSPHFAKSVKAAEAAAAAIAEAI